MATIFDLSPYNLYRLQSLDPVLDENYRDILEVIFPILDENSQDALLTRNLEPRGINCDLSRRMFSHTKPDGLETVLQRGGGLAMTAYWQWVAKCKTIWQSYH